MPLRLTLLCHGATAATRTAAFPGDEPLEAQAWDRARAVAATLPRAERVLVSPALRARQTAHALGLAPDTDPALAECDYGLWAGRPVADVQADDPEGLAAWLCNPDAAPHGGESIAAVMLRMGAWLDRHSAEKGHLLALTHATVARCALVQALEAPAALFWRLDMGPLSIADLRHDGRRWTWRAPAPGGLA